MAYKMKNGLRRIQIYVSEETYQKLLPQQTESKLSESAFYGERATGEEQGKRGAPIGNQNARKKDAQKYINIEKSASETIRENLDSKTLDNISPHDIPFGEQTAIETENHIDINFDDEDLNSLIVNLSDSPKTRKDKQENKNKIILSETIESKTQIQNLEKNEDEEDIQSEIDLEEFSSDIKLTKLFENEQPSLF